MAIFREKATISLWPFSILHSPCSVLLCTFPYTYTPSTCHYYYYFPFSLDSIRIHSYPTTTHQLFPPNYYTSFHSLTTPPSLFSPSPYHIFNSCGSVDVSWFLRPLPIHRYWRALWTVPSLLFFPFPFLSPLVIRLRPSFHHPSPLQHFSSSNKKGALSLLYPALVLGSTSLWLLGRHINSILYNQYRPLRRHLETSRDLPLTVTSTPFFSRLACPRPQEDRTSTSDCPYIKSVSNPIFLDRPALASFAPLIGQTLRLDFRK